MKLLLVVAAAALSSCIGPLLPLPEPATLPASPSAETTQQVARPARAFAVTRATDLLDGAVADGRIGDYRLDNELVTVIISAPTHAIGFAESGGNVIDAAPVGGRDALQQVYGYLSDNFPRQPVYDRVEVGDRSGTAVVVARGHDSDAPAIAVETEYALAPGTHALRITSTFSNEGKTALSRFAIGDAVEWGRSEHFVPDKGFDSGGHFPVDAGWVAGFGDDAAYAYVIAEGPLDGRHGWAWSDFNTAAVDLPAGASVKVTRWLVVSTPSDPAFYEAIAALRKSRWARLSGRILEEATGETLSGARVFFDGRDGPLAVTRSTPQGYEVLLPPGDYRIRAEGIGRSGPEQLLVTVDESGGATHDVIMSRRGALQFTVRDDSGPSPARLTLYGIAPTPDPHLGPAFTSPGENSVVSVRGAGEIALPPGHYHVIASRGPEYAIDDQRVDVAAGGTARASFQVRRAVDAFGWRCVDPHQHAFPSSDSAVSLVDRAASNLAEGLDVIVATDHNTIGADWKAAIAELHPAHPLGVIVGDEVSLERFGHFSVLPLPPEPTAPHGGAPEVRGRTPAEVLRALKAPDRVVTVNHPRAGGRTGYFENLALDEHTPLPKELGSIDAVEIFSGKDVSKVEPVLRDWLGLLDRGLLLTAVGGSDSHLIAAQQVGWPRTCFPVAGELDAAAFVAAVKRRHEALVTNGPFVRVSVAGHGMGQLAPAPRGRARLDVEIEAAPWIDVRRLELFMNGSRRGKAIDLPVAAPSPKPLRYKGSIELRVDRDSYVVVVVRGDTPLGAVLPPDAGQSPPTALAITNPIFLDRDGDGRWTAPNTAGKAPTVK